MSRLLAIDPSLTASGWVLVETENIKVIDAGVLKSSQKLDSFAQRIEHLDGEIRNLLKSLNLSGLDFLVCEGPAPLLLNPQSSLKIEQVRCIFETVARENKICVPGRLNPRSVQAEIMGLGGKQLKRELVKQVARDTVERYERSGLIKLEFLLKEVPSKKISQDIIDAILIALLASTKINLAKKTASCVYDLFAEKSSKKNSNSRNGIRWSAADLKQYL